MKSKNLDSEPSRNKKITKEESETLQTLKQ